MTTGADTNNTSEPVDDYQQNLLNQLRELENDGAFDPENNDGDQDSEVVVDDDGEASIPDPEAKAEIEEEAELKPEETPESEDEPGNTDQAAADIEAGKPSGEDTGSTASEEELDTSENDNPVAKVPIIEATKARRALRAEQKLSREKDDQIAQLKADNARFRRKAGAAGVDIDVAARPELTQEFYNEMVDEHGPVEADRRWALYESDIRHEERLAKLESQSATPDDDEELPDDDEAEQQSAASTEDTMKAINGNPTLKTWFEGRSGDTKDAWELVTGIELGLPTVEGESLEKRLERAVKMAKVDIVEKGTTKTDDDDDATTASLTAAPGTTTESDDLKRILAMPEGDQLTALENMKSGPKKDRVFEALFS